MFPSSISISTLPAIAFDIGGTPCLLHREDLSYADAGSGYTYGGIQSRGNLPFSIYGDTVLKSMYAIFDQGEKRFGFVQRADSDDIVVAEAAGGEKVVVPPVEKTVTLEPTDDGAVKVVTDGEPTFAIDVDGENY